MIYATEYGIFNRKSSLFEYFTNNSICKAFSFFHMPTRERRYITTILKYNKENEIKKTFANRVFMYSDKKYENKVFEVNNTIPRKNKKLKITDDTIVSSEFLYDEEELQYGYIEVLERMIDSYQLTKRQKEAMNYAITSVRMIERMKPLIKDLGLIMKE